MKAGLRACEIARLTWPMVLNARGHVGNVLELHDRAAKQRSGRIIPLHPMLQRALVDLARCERKQRTRLAGPVIRSERNDAGPMRPSSVVNWFAALYCRLALDGCSSHSGRRTFVTMAARQVHRVGGSLRDVQQLAGHRSIEMTQRYIDGHTAAQRRLVRLL